MHRLIRLGTFTATNTSVIIADRGGKMASITKEMVFAAYSLGKEVCFGKLNFSDGTKQLTKNTGMNHSSSQNYIYVLRSMLSGTCYTRTINEFATDYFLCNIGLEFGAERQQNAAKATLQHVEYYKEIRSYLKGIKLIAMKYL